MTYKDTLEIYDELKEGGCTEAQARAQAKQLGKNAKDQLELRASFVEAQNLTNIILSKVDKDLFWLRWVGLAMTSAFIANVFIK